MNDRSGPKNSRKRRLRLAAAIVLAMFLPLMFFSKPDQLQERIVIDRIDFSPTGELSLQCHVENDHANAIEIQGQTVIVEERHGDRRWILPGDRRKSILFKGRVLVLAYRTAALPPETEIRLRLSRYRTPSRLDHIFHWLSIHCPGSEIRRWFREHIGPNSIPLYSDWFEYRHTEP